MYETFGAAVDHTAKTVTFQLFFPDNTLDPNQYGRGGLPHIAELRVVGDFQSQLGGANWDPATAPVMQKRQYQKIGWLYSFTTRPLPENFYQYKYYVTFENGTTR